MEAIGVGEYTSLQIIKKGRMTEDQQRLDVIPRTSLWYQIKNYGGLLKMQSGEVVRL